MIQSLKFDVCNYEDLPSYTVYNITVYALDQTWDIVLRYSQIDAFNNYLMKTYKGIGNLGLPGKTFFKGSKFVKETRRDGI